VVLPRGNRGFCGLEKSVCSASVRSFPEAHRARPPKTSDLCLDVFGSSKAKKGSQLSPQTESPSKYDGRAAPAPIIVSDNLFVLLPCVQRCESSGHPAA
jgi:hypothetical protein